MDDGIFEAQCPCCGSKLEIDGDRGVILSHQEPKRAIVPENLQDAVKRLKSEETAREQRFRDQFTAELNKAQLEHGQPFTASIAEHFRRDVCAQQQAPAAATK